MEAHVYGHGLAVVGTAGGLILFAMLRLEPVFLVPVFLPVVVSGAILAHLVTRNATLLRRLLWPVCLGLPSFFLFTRALLDRYGRDMDQHLVASAGLLMGCVFALYWVAFCMGVVLWRRSRVSAS
jgi:hypothetical protein